MRVINKKLGGPPVSIYGAYSQVTSTTRYDDRQITNQDRFYDIVDLKAVFVAAIMLLIPFDQISTDICTKIAATMKKFTDRGVYVWLRFAFEMNWYVRDGPKSYTGTGDLNIIYRGTPAEFFHVWDRLARAIKDNGTVKMFWCPNIGDDINLQWPDLNNVDIVGLDLYPEDMSKTFKEIVKPFHDRYALIYNKPFAISETGVRGSTADFKIWWLKQLVDSDSKKALSNYVASA